jgi:shikimate kinase
VARLVLVGLPGVGKSTIARALAQEWRCDVLDTDEVLAANVGSSAAQYLREHGEPSFRERELEALREALRDDAIVATGAGIVTTSAARDALVDQRVLWLDVDDEILLGRVVGGERPLLGENHREALEKLRTQREAWYQLCAGERLDASGSIDEVVRRVVERVESVSS